VGSNRTRKVDVRVVAATNRDLQAMCSAGRFREDLYYRLNVVTILLPPLRERDGDVELLARHFLAAIRAESGSAPELTAEALAALRAWRWPGNVRELENELRRAAVFAKGKLGLADLSARITGGLGGGGRVAH
jgi:transcriptional regulator with GAF, ATPase, and Fis domain